MSKIPFAYLLLGPEEGEKSDFIQRIRDLIAKKSGAAPDEYTYYSFETPVGDAIGLLRNGSLFAAHTLVIYHGAEDIKKKDDVASLSDYLKHPSEHGTIIFTSGQPRVDGKWTAAVPSDAKKIFWEMFDNQKLGWLTGYFQKQGLSIDRDAAELFLELVENNTQELRREADRLCLFFGRGTTITEEDVETYLYHSKEENVFSLFDQVVVRDLEGALEILQKILLSSENNPVQILAGLSWQFRKLLSLRRLLDRRYDSAEAYRTLSIRSKRNQKTYAIGARNYPAAELENVAVMIGECDASLRSGGSALHPLLLERFLYNVIVGKATAPVGAGGVASR